MLHANESLSNREREGKGLQGAGLEELWALDEGQQLGGDIHHDPWLTPGSPDLRAIAAAVFAEVEAAREETGRQRSDAKGRRRAVVGNLVANLAVAALSDHGRGRRVALSARRDATTRYDRPGFSARLVMDTVNAMAALGILLVSPGTRRMQRTTIEPTERFLGAASRRIMHVGRAEGAETIILKAKVGRTRSKVLVDYDDTEDTDALRREMEAINGFLAGADISLADDGRALSPAFLTRRFQIDGTESSRTFDQHGRLYGGFWMSLPKEERHRLRVNGEPIVDLDFAGMFIQLAYIRAGIPRPNRSAYDGIEGLPRDAAKMGLSALLCRSGPMQRLPSELRELTGNGWDAKRLTAALVDHHPGIAHLFGKGVGLYLMKTESDILVATLRELFASKVPALPMHDGIMVPESAERAGRRAMAMASLKVVGTALEIVKKPIALPNGNCPPME